MADRHAVPAGGALAVDRGRYSAALTEALDQHPLVSIERREQQELPGIDEIAVLATGPLTSEPLAEDLRRFTGRADRHFFDAASPIVHGDSIDNAIAFRASRYDKGDADYINCPMDREQYLAFRDALLTAEQADLKDFDQEQASFFEGCLPIEELPAVVKTPCATDRSSRSVSGSPLGRCERSRCASCPPRLCGGATASGGPRWTPVESGGFSDESQMG